MKHEVLVLREMALLTLLDGMTYGCDMSCWKKYLFVVPHGVYLDVVCEEEENYCGCELSRLASTLRDLNSKSVTNRHARGEAKFVRHSSGLNFMFVTGQETAIGTWWCARKYFRRINARVSVKIVRKIMRVDEKRIRVSYG